jgi:hypothetical protein
MAIDVDKAPGASPFTEPASPERLHRVARALEANGFITHVADTADDARRVVLDLIPWARRFTLAPRPHWRRSGWMPNANRATMTRSAPSI